MQEFWDNHKNNINLLIKDYFNSNNKLVNSMTYSLLAGGKKVRSLLSAASSYALQKDCNLVLEYALAIEFIHTYSLIHDDLPGMDNSDFRRGKASNHKMFGEGVAILAGDALLTEAFLILSKIKFSANCKLKVVELVSRSAGFLGMCGGQLLDLEMQGKTITPEELLRISELKTGALIEASVIGPAYLFEATEEKINALSTYGKNLGIVFQMVDDLLDVIGNKEVLGKDTGNDHKNFKKTFPHLLGIDKTRELIKKHYDEAINSLEIFGENKKYLCEIAEFIVERDR